jgi:hypothetical protein
LVNRKQFVLYYCFLTFFFIFYHFQASSASQFLSFFNEYKDYISTIGKLHQSYKWDYLANSQAFSMKPFK